MDKCYICKSTLKDDIKYGEFLTRDGMSVHNYCLYLTSNLAQDGEDNEGFFGFLHADIIAEQKRISRLKCCYCGKAYANIGCCEVRCKRSFHTICGLENGTENQFTGTYESYCNLHVHPVKYRPTRNESCCICYDSLKGPKEPFDTINMLRAPCCKNGWFHKLCLQKFAKTAGYFFKCPLCNDNDVFRKQLSKKGIFIPNCDAAWELEPNAYAELLERPSSCSAEVCVNKKGRNENSERNPLLMCSSCGSIAIHQRCMPNPKERNFHCDDCTNMIGEDSGCGSVESPPPHFSKENQTDDEDMEVDVCNISSEDEEEDLIQIVRKNPSRFLLLDDEDEEEDEEEDLLQIVRKNPSRFLLLDDDDEEEDEEEERYNETRVTQRKVLESEAALTKTQPTAQYSSEDSSSDGEDIQAHHYNKIRELMARKIPILIHSDEDSDNSVLCSNELSKMEATAKKPENILSSDDDDDPLENFTTFVEKKKQSESLEILKVPKVRIRKLQMPTNSQRFSSSISVQRMQSAENEHLNNMTMDCVDINPNEPPTIRSPSASEVSCIARRTRRRSNVKKSIDNKELTPAQPSRVKFNLRENSAKIVYNDEASCSSSTVTNSGTEKDTRQHENVEASQELTTRLPSALETSCIARRTRRKSMCQNSMDNITELTSEHTLRDRIQLHANTVVDLANDDEETNCYLTKAGNSETNKDYRQHESESTTRLPSALETSCIALRTRRKSMCQNSMDNITELTSEHTLRDRIQLHANTVVDLANDDEATNCYLTKTGNSETNKDSWQHESESTTRPPSALEISCIARRTRRKSMCQNSMDNITELTQTLNTMDHIGPSEVYRRPSHPTSAQSSQEKNHLRTNTVVDLVNDEEATNSYLTKARNSVTNKDSRQHETEEANQQSTTRPPSALEISCIARRTRRKSMCQNSMDNITELPPEQPLREKIQLHANTVVDLANDEEDTNIYLPKARNSKSKKNLVDDHTNGPLLANESQGALDISCIAKRTRRKSCCDSNPTKNVNAHDQENSQDSLHPSTQKRFKLTTTTTITDNDDDMDSVSAYSTASENEHTLTGASSFQSACSERSLSPASSHSNTRKSGFKSKIKRISLTKHISAKMTPSRAPCRQRSTSSSSISSIIVISDDEQSDSPTISNVYSPPLRSFAANHNRKADPYLMPKFKRIDGKLKRDLSRTAHLKSTRHSNGR